MIELSDCPRTAGCSSQISVELALLGELASSAPSMTATFYIVSDAKTDRERETERQSCGRDNSYFLRLRFGFTIIVVK